MRKPPITLSTIVRWMLTNSDLPETRKLQKEFLKNEPDSFIDCLEGYVILRDFFQITDEDILTELKRQLK